MPTINPKTGTVTGPTVPGKSKETPTPIKKETGFVSKPTSQPRPVRPSLPDPAPSNT